jgi:hypothetical protein
MVCSEFKIYCRNWVVCSDSTFAAELCVLQQIWNSLPELSCVQRINIRCRIVCSTVNLGFTPKLNCLQPLNIHCRIVSCNKFGVHCLSCMVCIKFEIHYQNWVVCSELTFTAELCVFQWIWDSLSKFNCLKWICNSLSKLSCLQRINIRCSFVSLAANIVFDVEVVWSAVNSVT